MTVLLRHKCDHLCTLVYLDTTCLHTLCNAGQYRDKGGMLFAGDEFQEIVLKYYAYITHQKGAWIPEKDSNLVTPKELAYVDLCVSPAPVAL